VAAACPDRDAAINGQRKIREPSMREGRPRFICRDYLEETRMTRGCGRKVFGLYTLGLLSYDDRVLLPSGGFLLGQSDSASATHPRRPAERVRTGIYFLLLSRFISLHDHAWRSCRYANRICLLASFLHGPCMLINPCRYRHPCCPFKKSR